MQREASARNAPPHCTARVGVALQGAGGRGRVLTHRAKSTAYPPALKLGLDGEGDTLLRTHVETG
jgi:hypothetical protein